MFHTGRYPDTDSALAAIDGTKDPPVRVLKQELAPSLYGCDISMLDIMIISKNYTASTPIDERTNALVRCLSTLSNRAEISSPVRVHIEFSYPVHALRIPNDQEEMDDEEYAISSERALSTSC